MITVVASSSLETEASPGEVQNLIFYTWRDICKHLTSSVCVRLSHPSPCLFFLTLFTLLLTGGISCQCIFSFFCRCRLSQSRWRLQRGCRQEKPPIDNVPKKTLCLHKMTRKDFDGKKCPTPRSPAAAAASHLPLLVSSSPVCDPLERGTAGPKHLAAVSQRGRG